MSCSVFYPKDIGKHRNSRITLKQQLLPLNESLNNTPLDKHEHEKQHLFTFSILPKPHSANQVNLKRKQSQGYYQLESRRLVKYSSFRKTNQRVKHMAREERVIENWVPSPARLDGCVKRGEQYGFWQRGAPTLAHARREGPLHGIGGSSCAVFITCQSNCTPAPISYPSCPLNVVPICRAQLIP